MSRTSKEEIFVEHLEHSASQCSAASTHAASWYSAPSSSKSFSTPGNAHDVHDADDDHGLELEGRDSKLEHALVNVVEARAERLL